jgi:hypothetical protein
VEFFDLTNGTFDPLDEDDEAGSEGDRPKSN